MNRKTLTALAVLGILAAVTAVVLRQPQKGERVGERPRPIAKLAPGSFDTIAVTKAGVTTVITRAGDKYSVTAPVRYAADDNVAKQAFEALEKLEFGDTVSEQKAKHAEFEVDDAKGIRVTARKGDQVLVELLVGKSVGGNTLVRIPGKDEVWQGLGSFRYNFDRDTSNWRDKTITKFTPTDVEKVDVKGKDGSRISVKKEGQKGGKEGDDTWTVLDSSVKIDKLDNTTPSGIVSLLSSWVTNEFADDAKPDTTGLSTPNATITVTLKGGKTVTALIGNKKGDEDIYVKTADSPQVFLVKRYNVDRADKRPIDFKDKTLCDLSDTELGQLAIVHDKDSYTLVKTPDKGSQKGEWKATKPSGLTLDPAKVTPLTTSFKDWKAAGYADNQVAKDNGLAKPRAVITARSKDGKKSCTLKVGNETKDKVNYVAQSGVASDVYLVPKWSTDRLLIKIDDLKKK